MVTGTHHLPYGFWIFSIICGYCLQFSLRSIEQMFFLGTPVAPLC
jgi:hypothetical protein